ncbi:Tachykinin-like peptides receptor 86C [Acipenser ruthenus]|uniref:Tachykinin-like peptides receptor 86C n=1 Tax=Acipenser ruthenus TaxID=7906 RepID=A0A444UVC3_ACIRT|nr:Tachykinin-like peptides receptor 86C [Acipenser ruthenus]
MAEASPVQAVLFGVLVFTGILGNVLVIFTVISTSLDSHHLPPPTDIILVNLALANLLTSVFRTVPIFISDLGVEVYLSTGWCRVFMFAWVWWRSVGVWATFSLSLFHFVTLRRQGVTGALARRAELRKVGAALFLVWALNFLYSLPAFLYSAHVRGNSTVEFMVISCTTRPLLGCIWEFPSPRMAVVFATSSLAVHEVVPTVLMVAMNLATLCMLKRHIRSVAGAELTGCHVDRERKASKVIVVLVTLFVVCWGTQMLSVSYYNYNRGDHAVFLLTLAHFTSSIFVGFSPLVVAFGHSKLRNRIKRMLLWGRERGQGGGEGEQGKGAGRVISRAGNDPHPSC